MNGLMCLGRLVLLLLVAQTTAAMDPEDVFETAKDYTVRLDVTISTPFIEDSLGAHLGAGFIVDRQRRWVLTNAHVAGSSPSTLEAVFENGTRIKARKVYVDSYIDLAVVELLGDDPLKHEASLGCEQKLGIGHAVGAFGHPWGLNFTGTQGVISGRTLNWGPEHLQTDTPINGGNSGGPLISMKTGKIVGINTSSINSKDDQNTNFAIPIAQACRILSLLRDGRDPSPPDLATTFYKFIDDQGPMIVARTYLGEDQLGLHEGDEILAANGSPVNNASELVHELRGHLDAVRLSVRRDDSLLELEGTLNPRPNVIERRGVEFSGILFADGVFHDFQAMNGSFAIMIHSIEPGSDGDGEELALYDFVSRVNGLPIRDLQHLHEILSTVKEADEVRFDLLRISFDDSHYHFFELVRRDVKWSEPNIFGQWNELVGSALKLDE